MKVFSTIAKIVAAVAFVAGAVYLVATYGDKMVAWAKKLLKCGACEDEVVEEAAEEAVEAPAEETEEAAQEAPEAAEGEPVAEDTDFVG